MLYPLENMQVMLSFSIMPTLSICSLLVLSWCMPLLVPTHMSSLYPSTIEVTLYFSVEMSRFDMLSRVLCMR